jgi:hypothetical protein
MSKKEKMLGAAELCPCGSGKQYIDCCLDKRFQFIYVKDEEGNITKKKTEAPKQESTEEDEKLNFLEHAETVAPFIWVIFDEEGAPAFKMNETLLLSPFLPINFLKHLICIVGDVKAIVLSAINAPVNEIRKNETMHLLCIGFDEEQDPCGFGSTINVQNIPDPFLFSMAGFLDGVQFSIYSAIQIKSNIISMKHLKDFMDYNPDEDYDEDDDDEDEE